MKLSNIRNIRGFVVKFLVVALIGGTFASCARSHYRQQGRIENRNDRQGGRIENRSDRQQGRIENRNERQENRYNW